MTRILVWDLPTRMFHWLLTFGFIGAAFIALALGEDSMLFPYHSIIGLTLALMVVLRIVWGFAGTRHARFSSFVFGPRALAAYLRDAFRRKDERHTGHNPGSAYAILAMLALLLAQAATGFMLGRGNDGVKELHEVLAYAMVAVVVVHVAGVAFYSLRHRENITIGMIDGRKVADGGEAIASSRPIAAIVFLVLCGAWCGSLLASYDAAAQTAHVPLLGLALQLGEGEGAASEGGEGDEGMDGEREHGEDEDDD